MSFDDELKTRVTEVVNPDGTYQHSDPLIKYKDAGMDIAGTPMYFGYIALDSSWYIKRLDTTSGTTFTKGASDYPTAWTGRAGLTYDLFNNIF